MAASIPDDLVGPIEGPPTAQATRVEDVRAPGDGTLRADVIRVLEDQGFRLTGRGVLEALPSTKAEQRAMHLLAVESSRSAAAGALRRLEPAFIRTLVAGSDLRVPDITPRLLLVDDRRSDLARMWRWIALHWSVPVSAGYGRRLRFVVVDAAHGDAPIGIIGLGDPVFALRARDTAIGWTRETRMTGLSSVMDAFALGAVPPYSNLLGGKLMAMLAMSDEVREIFRARYGHRQSIISGRDPNAHLALVTTASALGRSSTYNRLRREDGTLAFLPVGYTEGSGDFHLSGPIYERLARQAQSVVDHRSQNNPRWPAGRFRSRREVIQVALTSLGFDAHRVRVHGLRRELFVGPLAKNSMEWLQSGDNEAELDWYEASVDHLSSWWKQRWATPRSARTLEWLSFDPAEWTLWSDARRPS